MYVCSDSQRAGSHDATVSEAQEQPIKWGTTLKKTAFFQYSPIWELINQV